MYNSSDFMDSINCMDIYYWHVMNIIGMYIYIYIYVCVYEKQVNLYNYI